MDSQRRCMECGSLFLGKDWICRTCRKRLPNWDPKDHGIIIERAIVPPEVRHASKSDDYDKLTVEDIPFPKGQVVIPKKEDRDYRATIIITTPDIMGENFRFCKYRIDKYTPGEHRLVVIETHFNEKPYNYARDINIGLRGVQDSDYLIMLNDDVFVEEGWLDKLVQCAREDAEIGIVGVLLFYPGKRIVQHAGGNYNRDIASWATYGQMPVLHSHAGKPTKIAGDTIYDHKYVPWNTGALLLVTKTCIDKIGLMDEKLVAHCDDVEYNFRAWINGFKVIYCPDVQAVHRENITRVHGTSEAPSYVFEATKHLIRVLSKKGADKVQDKVDESNARLCSD